MKAFIHGSSTGQLQISQPCLGFNLHASCSINQHSIVLSLGTPPPSPCRNRPCWDAKQAHNCRLTISHRRTSLPQQYDPVNGHKIFLRNFPSGWGTTTHS